MGRLCIFLFLSFLSVSAVSGSKRIQPWSKNPLYWQYKKRPVLLLGASGNDNLFQSPNLETHLDSLIAAGGNYVRNTMSDRDAGDVRAYERMSDGRYDLNRWNPEYWERFERLLRYTRKRDVIVQIEIWDRFDHSQRFWDSDPYNPKNNVNYTSAESGLAESYPFHPGLNRQPFFFSVPALDDNAVLLAYQQAFVRKLLDISLKYPHVLYCIDNETSGREEWSAYWVAFIREAAGDRTVCLTEMWDDWNMRSAMHKRTLDYPARYDFVDISQNAHAQGDANWDGILYVREYVRQSPRPLNSVKIYGSGARTHGGDSEHAVATFCRNVLGGLASSRFHRPPAGLGLCEISMHCIGTIRQIERCVRFWDLRPRKAVREGVYSSRAANGIEVVFFSLGVPVIYRPADSGRSFEVRWFDAASGAQTTEKVVVGADGVDLKPPYPRNCFAVLIPV